MLSPELLSSSSLLHWHGISRLITLHIHLFVAACHNINSARYILVFYFWTCTPLVLSLSLLSFCFPH